MMNFDLLEGKSAFCVSVNVYLYNKLKEKHFCLLPKPCSVVYSCIVALSMNHFLLRLIYLS